MPIGAEMTGYSIPRSSRSRVRNMACLLYSVVCFGTGTTPSRRIGPSMSGIPRFSAISPSALHRMANAPRLDPLAALSDAHELPRMGSPTDRTLRDPVALGDHRLDARADVGEGGTDRHGERALLVSLGTADRLGVPSHVEDAIRGDELVGDVGVPRVRGLVVEAADERLVHFG